MNMSISALQQAYQSGATSPEQVLANIRQLSEQYRDRNIWIYQLTEQDLQPYLDALADKDPECHPLWGIPFVIKDNIDLAGIPTTAACEAFAYTPEQSATVVQQLIDAGAIPVGKSNLDQFATGLNGTRSPYGACKNAFDPQYISGGSSSGSAVAVSLGLASFSLGTDTAGSGRVPACFNNLVGLKPSRGLLSSTGMVPACHSLDCMTVFALNTDDANAVFTVAEGFDAADAYSRKNTYLNNSRHYGSRDLSNNNPASSSPASLPLIVGIIPDAQLKFFGDEYYQNAYQKTLAVLKEQNIKLIEIDFAPFDEAARLLYEGPWVSERYLATLPLIEQQPEAIFPVVHDIIAPGIEPKATELFKAQYRLNQLKTVCDQQLETVDCLLTPTAGRCFTIEEMLSEPIKHNSELGYYTNFMNLLDMASVAVPTQITEHGLPFGITLVGPAFSDRALLSIANSLQPLFDLPLGKSDMKMAVSETAVIGKTDTIDVLVCGAHLDGLPLNWQLKERGAVLKTVTQTAPVYRMYALAGGPPFRPGLILDEAKGAAIDVEIWSVPTAEFGSFVAGIPAPLGIGKVRVADGSVVSGFICEPCGIDGAEEITHLGGWRAYMANR